MRIEHNTPENRPKQPVLQVPNIASFIMRNHNFIGLIMLGAGHRTAIAAIVVAMLWTLFYWATYTPGSL